MDGQVIEERDRWSGQVEKSILLRCLRWLLLASVVVVPIFVMPGARERFRLPKEALFRGSAILALALFVIVSLVLQFHRTIRWRHPITYLIGGILLWTVITTLTSTNRTLSLQALITVLASIVLFLMSWTLTRGRSFVALDVVMIPAIVNAVVYVLQETGVWNPFSFAEQFTGHVASSALLGNPNDVGSFLAPVALAASAVVLTTSGSRRIVYLVVAVALTLALIASQTITAIGAFFVALTVMSMMRWPRHAIAAVLVVLTAGALAVGAHAPLRTRATNLSSAFRAGDFNRVLTFRLPAFLTAWEMAKSHPLTGVGPGCFAWHYLPYLLELRQQRSDDALTMPSAEQYAEVHNDHLQTLAETGAPGYILFLAAAAILGLSSFSRARGWLRRAPIDLTDEPAGRPFPQAQQRPAGSRRYTTASDAAGDSGHSRLETARLLACPLAVLFLVLTLAQFPLQLAAPRLIFLYLAGLALAWSES